MTQQFLNDFRVLAIGVQDSSEGMANVCEPIPLVTNVLRGWFDIDAKARVRPMRRTFFIFSLIPNAQVVPILVICHLHN